MYVSLPTNNSQIVNERLIKATSDSNRTIGDLNLLTVQGNYWNHN